MSKCHGCAYNTVCSGEHDGCRHLPATVVICPMCGKTVPPEDELIPVEVDGTQMDVCAECAYEIELK